MYDEVVNRFFKDSKFLSSEKWEDLETQASSSKFESLCLDMELCEVEAFSSFEYDIIRTSANLTIDMCLYIFYNIMDKRHQLFAATEL